MQPGVGDAVEELWRRFVPLVRQRVSSVEAYLSGHGTREEARQAAHKLAGGLGSYGRGEASRDARLIEALLQGDGPQPAPGSAVHEALARLQRALQE